VGADKPGVVVGNRSMLDHVLAAAADTPTLVVGRPHPRSPWVADAEPGGGPLAGLVAALEFTGGPVVLVGADQPWLRAETVRHLAAGSGVLPAAPEDAGHRQVLCARYPAECLGAARVLLGESQGLQALLDQGCEVMPTEHWQAWGEDGRSWFSVNTPADLATGLDRYGAPR
jgi:molybdopterin-guanine dinucleotide biosynthesis protein A